MIKMKKWTLAAASMLFCLAAPFTSLAATKIGSISLTIDSDIEVGDLDSRVEVTGSSSRYTVDTEVTNTPEDGWENGDRPKLLITLSTDGDYYFSSALEKSDVDLNGDDGTVTSLKRTREEVRIYITLMRLDDDIDNDYDLTVRNPEWDEADGVAYWDEADDAKKYEVKLYRNGDVFSSVRTTSDGEYNFASSFTRSGNYSFKVRGVRSSTVKGDWVESDIWYVSSSEAADIRENDEDNKESNTGSAGNPGTGTNNPGPGGNNPGPGGAAQGAWLLDTKVNKWWYCRADKTYPVNDWMKINNYWYFFDEAGYMKTGWILWKGLWYYCCDNGEMLTNTMTPDGYYVGADGVWR